MSGARTTSITVLATAAALAATACNFPHTVTGTVTALPADCGAKPSAPGAPVALPGAVVTIRCPGAAAPVFEATADATGHVRREIPGSIALDCEFVVTKEGHAPRTYAMRDVCADEAMAPSCGTLSFSARLVTVAAPGAPRARRSTSDPRR